jgi:hypothetical protein
MRRTSKQLLKATSLPSVNDKGRYMYIDRYNWAGHVTVMALLLHSHEMTWKTIENTNNTSISSLYKVTLFLIKTLIIVLVNISLV